MTERLQVGIIGCGEIVQAVHRPVLLGLAKHFAIASCTDASSEAAESLAASTGARVAKDAISLIQDNTTDVVLIAAPDPLHSEYVIAACEAGKKGVLVEKPLTMNARMARDVESHARRSKTSVIVGYPHLYDPAVIQARRLWTDRDKLLFGEFRTILGPNDGFVQDVAEIVRPTVLPADIAPPFFPYWTSAGEIVGFDRANDLSIRAYNLLLRLNIHDLPVMRALLGMPDEVTYATTFGPGGAGLCIAFKYGEGLVLLNSTFQTAREADWGFELRSREKTVTVQYPSSYATTAGSTCSVRGDGGGTIHEELWRGSYVSGFRAEWLHLYDLATGQTQPQNALAEAVGDLELLEEILKVIAK